MPSAFDGKRCKITSEVDPLHPKKRCKFLQGFDNQKFVRENRDEKAHNKVTPVIALNPLIQLDLAHEMHVNLSKHRVVRMSKSYNLIGSYHNCY